MSKAAFGERSARPPIAATHRTVLGGSIRSSAAHGPATARPTRPSRVVIQRCGDQPCSCSDHERRAHAAATGLTGTTTAASIERLRSGGSRLDGCLRREMEAAVGTPLGGVRIHTDGAAERLASQLGAQAFTTGQDIFFARGAFQPATVAGRHLLAHELAHVAQQAAGPVAGTPQGDVTVSDPSDPFEQEADLVADRVSARNSTIRAPVERRHGRGPRRASTKVGSPLNIQRQEGKPPIPLPVFDQLDPGVSVPDVPGVPGFLRGQRARLSDVKKALDVIRGVGHKNPPDCSPFVGFERARMGEFAGMCCHGRMRSKENCCDYKDIALADYRCCTGPLEVIIDNHCVKLSLAPIVPKLPTPPPSTPIPQAPTNQPVPVAISVPFKLDKPSAGATGSAALQASMETGGAAVLSSLIATLKADPALRVQLVGRASPEGTDAYNLDLGARRAGLVADAVIEGGAAAQQIDDPPANDLLAACQPVRKGVATCGRSGATGPADRQVLARFSRAGAQP